MVELFKHGGVSASKEQVVNWLKKESDEGFLLCQDFELAGFLNGFIIEKRGKKEGTEPVLESKLTNNLIMVKLKIALNLKADDIITLLEKVGFSFSKSELSALFRRPEHKHYRVCKTQVLRNFLTAIDKQYHVARPGSKATAKSKKKPTHHVKEPKQQGARANISSIYQNPKLKSNVDDLPNKSKRKVLKLK